MCGEAYSGIGAYAEYIVVATKMLVHKPKQLSWEEAAGVPEVSFSSILQSTLSISRYLSDTNILILTDLDHSLPSPLPNR